MKRKKVVIRWRDASGVSYSKDCPSLKVARFYERELKNDPKCLWVEISEKP